MKRWSAREIKYLKEHRDQPYAKTASHLGRSAASVNGKYCMLAMELKVAPWSETDLAVLMEGVRKGKSDEAIAKALGRSENAVRQKRLLLGVRKANRSASG